LLILYRIVGHTEAYHRRSATRKGGSSFTSFSTCADPREELTSSARTPQSLPDPPPPPPPLPHTLVPPIVTSLKRKASPSPSPGATASPAQRRVAESPAASTGGGPSSSRDTSVDPGYTSSEQKDSRTREEYMHGLPAESEGPAKRSVLSSGLGPTQRLQRADSRLSLTFMLFGRNAEPTSLTSG
jgi:hypothetical protein